MKRKKISAIIVAIGLSVAMMGCQSNSSSSEKAAKTESTEKKSDKTQEKVDVDTSWYDSDGSAIASGMFVVGQDIKAGEYTFTSTYTDDDGSPVVAVFENMDNYKGFYTGYMTEYDTFESCLGTFAYYNTTVANGGTCSVNVSDGNILYIKDTKGTIVSNTEMSDSKFSVDSGKVIAKGIYDANQLKTGTYVVSPASDAESRIILFSNKDYYDDYKSSISTNYMEQKEAVGTFGDFDSTLNNGTSCMINISDDSVLLVEDSSCYIQKVNMDWSVK